MSDKVTPFPPPNRQLAAFCDEALALQFSTRHAHRLRYVAPWGKWHHWTGVRWEPDDTLHALDMARDLCRDMALYVPEHSKSVASKRTVEAVLSLARADRRHASTIGQWDTSPWLLNTPGGTVDLRTGDMRPHDPEDYITKCTAVAPGGECPLWRAFLDRVTDGDIQLQAFLQRMVGYALTGLTRDHAMFFLHGLGANGKSVFLNSIIGIWAAYHRTAPAELLLASKHDRHPTELAGLVGCRLVTATETEGGRRWAEAKIKLLTGGDTVSARFMGQNFFEFSPRFKLAWSGNSKPTLNRVDEAIRRRLNLVPFTVTIPRSERDPELTDKLKAEWPGILQWAIEGCAEWQEHGLAAPAVVTAATDAYLAEQDTIKNWLAECTVEDPTVETASSQLYASWKQWCEANGEFPGSNKSFSQKLQDQGLHCGKTGKVRFRGLRLTA
jgi:putative DNA primase/helicase